MFSETPKGQQMKTTILSVLLVTVMGSAFASGGNSIKVAKNIEFHQGQDNVYHLIYGDKSPGDVEVKFTDKKGKIVGEYTINNERGFKKKFNLSLLKAGDYTIEVSADDYQISKSFNIPPNVEMAAFKKGDQFRLITENNTTENFRVNIYDDEQELIHTEKQKDGFARYYDLSKRPSSSYTFEVVSNGTSQRVLLDN